MKVVFYLNIVSPHQLPLARAVAKCVGADNFIYIYVEEFHAERASMGWHVHDAGVRVEKLNEANRNLLESAEILYTGLRCVDLLERRSRNCLTTYYYSERWFKPFHGLPGWVRLLDPRYLFMARRMVRILKNSACVKYLPIGPYAARDMRIFGVPDRKMIPWGYFVEPSTCPPHPAMPRPGERPVRILWVGRLLKLKHVDTIVRAVAALARDKSSVEFSLTVVGDGPEKKRLEKLADTLVSGCGRSPFVFKPPVAISEVRQLMQEHDIYVFASDANDGWGAVVSEALEEGMRVIGSAEAGASAAMLPPRLQFNYWDWQRLRDLLMSGIPGVGIGKWTADNAAREIVRAIGGACAPAVSWR